MYDEILFPTDATKTDEKAVEDVSQIASLHDARVHVLHVVNESAVDALLSADPSADPERVEETLAEKGEEAASEVEQNCAEKGVETEVVIRQGRPEEEIVEYAESETPDLVVMATKKKPERYSDILGSVTETVMRSVDTRVMVVKTGEMTTT